jgi:hypothetical protein
MSMLNNELDEKVDEYTKFMFVISKTINQTYHNLQHLCKSIGAKMVISNLRCQKTLLL